MADNLATGGGTNTLGSERLPTVLASIPVILQDTTIDPELVLSADSEGVSQTGLLAQVARPFPDSSAKWADYFKTLPSWQPQLDILLIGFKAKYVASATHSDYLARIISGDLEGGPLVDGGMHDMALEGVKSLSQEEILNRLVHLDLAVRFFRRTHAATKAARARELATAAARENEINSVREMYERSEAMYHSEADRLDFERASLSREMDLFIEARNQFDRDLLRFSAAINVGLTIEEAQMNHDLMIERLNLVLHSTVEDFSTQIELLAQMPLSGGTAQWLQRSADVLRRSANLSECPAANRARLAEQELRHNDAMEKREEENDALKQEIEQLKRELHHVMQVKQENESLKRQLAEATNEQLEAKETEGLRSQVRNLSTELQRREDVMLSEKRSLQREIQELGNELFKVQFGNAA